MSCASQVIQIERAQRTRFPFLDLTELAAFWPAGTLPAAWGSGPAMANLLLLALSGNDLSGSIPAEWAQKSLAFPALRQIFLKPGTVQFCCLQTTPQNRHRDPVLWFFGYSRVLQVTLRFQIRQCGSLG